MTPTSASDWFTPRRFALVLALLIVAAFPEAVTGLGTFAYFDSGQFAYPVAFYHREAFWHGEFPSWNPLSSCGVPFLAQWNTMTLYPLSLFYLLFPLSWSFGIFELGHLFLAGMGMYFLAVRWTGNRMAAAAAGTVFAFNGLTWYGLMWPHLIAALAWMPWVVLAVEQAWHTGRQWLALAAMIVAMQLLTGGVEVILLTWLLLGVFWLAQVFQGEIPRGKLTGRMLCVIGLAAGLAAVQLLPFLDLLAHSQRNAGFGSSNMEAMPLTGWVNYFAPLFHCTRNAYGIFVQPGQTWTASYYLGMSIVALALVAAWRVRGLRVRLLFGLGVFSLLMALGGHGLVYDWAKSLVPLLGFMRFPVKFVLLTTFVLPLLAAYGLAWLLSLSIENRTREWIKVSCVTAGVLGVITVALWFTWRSPLPDTDTGAIIRNGLQRALFLVAIFACLILIRGQKDLKLQRLCQLSLIVLLWLDVFTHNSNLSPTVARAVMEPDAIRHFFNWDTPLRPDVSRAMQSQASFWRLLSTASGNPDLDVTGQRLTLFLNFNLLDHAAKFDGFYSLDLNEYLDVFKRVYFTTNQAVKLKDFLGISHISNPTNTVDWVTRDSFLSLVTAGQKPIFANREDTLNAIMSESFTPTQNVYLPLEAQSRVTAEGRGTATILSHTFRTDRIVVDMRADAPAIVVVAQNFYHPWHAYVDGRPTPLWRANHAFQALEVPAGKHQVNLAYEDHAFDCGAVLSLLSALACGVIWFQSRRDPSSGFSQCSTGGLG